MPSAELRAVHQRLLGDGPLPRRRFPRALRAASPTPAVRRPRRGAGALRDAPRSAASGGSCSSRASRASARRASLAAFARQAHERGDAVVLYGRCDEDALAPYQPFVEMMRQHGPAAVRRGPLAPGRRAARRRALPALRGRGRGARAARARRGARARLRRPALGRPPRRCCSSGTSPAPRRPSGCCSSAPIATSRAAPPLARPDRRPAARACRSSGMALAGLDAAETGELLTDLGSGGRRERLRELTGGNPLFLGELARAPAEDGATSPGPRASRRSCCAASGGCGEPAHEVLTLAAVAGQTFSAALLESEARRRRRRRARPGAGRRAARRRPSDSRPARVRRTR